MSISLIQKQLKGANRQQAGLWLELAHAQLQTNQKQLARQALKQALLAKQKPPEFSLHAADLALQLDDLAQCLTLIKQGILNRPPHYLALYQAASICERLNKLDEAEEWINKTLHASNHPQEKAEARVLQAKILIRKKAPEEALSLLEEQFPNANELPAKIGTEYQHTRYSAYDALEQYPEAYQALRSSKAINRAFIGEERLQQMKQQKMASYIRLESIIRGWNPEELRSWQSERGSQQDIAFLIGHPRSGTTLLENILDSHDELISSDEKTTFQDHVIDPLMKKFQPSSDPNIDNEALFRAYLNELPKETLTGTRKRYLDRLEDELGNRLRRHSLLDKNPAITDAGLLSLRLFPKARFLFAVRDPRAVVWSSFTLPSYGTTWISCFWFDLADAAEAYARFTDVWMAFREKLPPELSHTTRYEDVVAQPEKEGKEATEFLSLDWQSKQSRFYERAGEKHVHSPTYADVAQPVYTSALEKWKHYADYLQEGMPHLTKHLKQLGYS